MLLNKKSLFALYHIRFYASSATLTSPVSPSAKQSANSGFDAAPSRGGDQQVGGSTGSAALPGQSQAGGSVGGAKRTAGGSMGSTQPPSAKGQLLQQKSGDNVSQLGM